MHSLGHHVVGSPFVKILRYSLKCVFLSNINAGDIIAHVQFL
jgi:hypothetical protein